MIKLFYHKKKMLIFVFCFLFLDEAIKSKWELLKNKRGEEAGKKTCLSLMKVKLIGEKSSSLRDL